ncbi:MAG: GNAT family N-acetyltransferase [Chloroflexota bacterium]
MAQSRIVEVTDTESFGLVPPCADPRFDHRTCDYWEDPERGSKASRPALLEVRAPTVNRAPVLDDNPFASPPRQEPVNPFAPAPRASATGLFGDDDELFAPPPDNPFVPTVVRERPLREGVPRKLALLDRGRGVFGSYAKVLVAEGEPVAYCQFGPLSAYPRATRLRDLYPQLPASPLPAVITCIASTADARRQGHARTLVEAVCADLAERGFAAVEAYPDLTRPEDETSGARPEFWQKLGFETAVDDERFPVMRREL